MDFERDQIYSKEDLVKLAAEGALVDEGKKLVADFFTPALFSFRIEASDDCYLFTGMLKVGRREIFLAECIHLGRGRPPWFIDGRFLRILTNHVPWRVLNRAFHKENLLLSREEALAFLEECREEEIPLTLECDLSQSAAPSVLPVLELQDRSGAFANLMMRYGDGDSILYDGMGPCKGRDKELEKAWETDLLETAFIRKQVGTSTYYCPLNEVKETLLFLLECGWELRDWKKQRVVPLDTSELNAYLEKETIHITGKATFGGSDVSIGEVAGAFNRRDTFISLDGGGSGLLAGGHLEESLQVVLSDAEIIADRLSLPKNRMGSLAPLLETSGKISIDKGLERLRDELFDFSGITPITLGSEFQGTLRDYQQDGVNWFHFLYRYGFGGMLADDMGLGKTVQLLAFLSTLSPDLPVLIVVPRSLLFHWRQEITRFLPNRSVYIHHGPSRVRSVDLLSETKLILTSYHTLRQDAHLFSKLMFEVMVLDEAQVMKNARSLVAQTIVTVQAALRLSLTGTPMENRLEELWAHYHFLMPDLLGTEVEFAQEVKAVESDRRYLDKIKKKITPFLLRRTKEQVAPDLPEKSEQVVWVEMKESQRQLYEQFLANYRGNLLQKVGVDGSGSHRMEIFEAILRLRQLCCHPLLIDSLLDEEVERCSAKFDAVMRDLEQVVAEGAKVLVFSQFVTLLSLLQKEISSRGWSSLRLDGSTRNREEVVETFQNDPTKSIFLISLKAGGVGLNLTSADYVFLFDPWWNEAAENQAIDRAHRIGRERPVIARRYVTAESIEEKIMKLKAAKSSLVDQLIEVDDAGSALTTDDLLALFE